MLLLLIFFRPAIVDMATASWMLISVDDLPSFARVREELRYWMFSHLPAFVFLLWWLCWCCLCCWPRFIFYRAHHHSICSCPLNKLICQFLHFLVFLPSWMNVICKMMIAGQPSSEGYKFVVTLDYYLVIVSRVKRRRDMTRPCCITTVFLKTSLACFFLGHC